MSFERGGDLESFAATTFRAPSVPSVEAGKTKGCHMEIFCISRIVTLFVCGHGVDIVD